MYVQYLSFERYISLHMGGGAKKPRNLQFNTKTVNINIIKSFLIFVIRRAGVEVKESDIAFANSRTADDGGKTLFVRCKQYFG